LHELPRHLPPDVAVAMIGTGRTAMGILEVAAITADDLVVVPAAAGGLGALFVQAARRAGAGSSAWPAARPRSSSSGRWAPTSPSTTGPRAGSSACAP